MEIIKILQELDIEAKFVSDETPAEEPGTAVFQIPLNRLQEAIVALGYHGFSQVRAYATPPAAGSLGE